MPTNLTSAELKKLMDDPKGFLDQPNNAQKILGMDAASKKSLVDQIAAKKGVSAKEVQLKLGSAASEYSLISYKSKPGSIRTNRPA